MWETSLSAHSGDDVTGECYDDSAFDETVTINDATPDSITLTVAAGERHDGTAGTGARIVRTGSGNVIDFASTVDTHLSWLEIDLNGEDADACVDMGSATQDTATCLRCIIHDTTTIGDHIGIFINGITTTSTIANNIIYNIDKTSGSGSADVFGIDHDLSPSGKTLYVANNTIHNTSNDGGGSGDCEGLHIASDGAGNYFQNNIVTDTNGDNSGTIADYDASISTVTNISHNLSSDASAPGASSLTSKTAANQFVSTTGGSEDLHLKAGADAIDAGTDLGSTPTGVNIDINGNDRDVVGVTTWDMGAHEYELSAADNSSSSTEAESTSSEGVTSSSTEQMSTSSEGVTSSSTEALTTSSEGVTSSSTEQMSTSSEGITSSSTEAMSTSSLGVTSSSTEAMSTSSEGITSSSTELMSTSSEGISSSSSSTEAMTSSSTVAEQSSLSSESSSSTSDNEEGYLYAEVYVTSRLEMNFQVAGEMYV